MTRDIIFGLAIVLCTTFVAAAAEPKKQTWMVDSVEREGLIYAPASAKSKPAPVVFAFHGHGGSMNNAARMFRVHELWPEAIVVYLQGLPTPGRITDAEGKRAGWQATPGAQGDRDLKFFDAVFASLKSDYKIDEKHVFCTGHSNGGAFTYQLWAMRGDVFAAFAPSAAAANDLIGRLKPKPMLHLGATNDPLVKFEWQQRTIDAVLKIDGCKSPGEKKDDRLTLYPSSGKTPVETYIHDKGHSVPPGAAEVIVNYFKAQAKAL